MTKVLDQNAGLEEKRARLLAAVLKKKHIERPQATPIPRRAVHSPCVLSFAQQRLWFLEQMEPGNAVYNVPFALRISGELDGEALRRSMRRIVERHEVLRTVFVSNQEQEPEQRVLSVEDAGVVVEVTELGELAPEQREAEAQRLAGVEAGEGFNLSTGPLVRVKLLRMGKQEHVLLVTMHHIVSDGWSVGVLVREFMELYRAEREQRETTLEELAIQYGDYAAWQREWLGGGELEKQMAYWKEQLAGLEGLELPTDHARPAVMSHRGATVEMEWGEELTGRIRELCRREGVTLFMALLGGVQVLLGRYAGQREVAVGTPIANRMRQEIEPLIGFFVNTLVLRGEVRSEWSFREMLKRVREVTLASYAHQDVPFEHLVEELQPVRALSRNPLFQVMLIVQNAPQKSFSLPGWSVEGLSTEGGEMAKFDLTFAAEESAGKIKVGINYATELYEQATIERMARHFRAIVEQVADDAGERAGEIQLLDPSERKQLISEWNSVPPSLGLGKTVYELFEEQAERDPQAIALVYEDRRMSYGELNRRANQLAHHLMCLGVGPEARVALCMDRGPEMVVGILGVLKAGGAYVPLDPSHPPERLMYILQDANAQVLISAADHEIPSFTGPVLRLDGDWEQLASESAGNPKKQVVPENLAYVIYTSGSTGNPKGSLNTHHNLSWLLAMSAQRFNFGRQDVWTLFHSYAFDFSVWEMWGALAYGGRLVVVPFYISRSPREFYELLLRENVTVLNQTPSGFQQLLREGRWGKGESCLRYVIFGGELLEVKKLQSWFDCPANAAMQMVNMYGITETTVHVTFRELAPQDLNRGRSPIGLPLPGLQCYVLDEQLQPMPAGVPEELYVGGEGLSRGYLNRPDLTAIRFIPNPLSGRAGDRLYRTGDRARWLAGGELEYLRRLDQQVKIRGYRIELGEIEAALQEQRGVAQAVVVVQEDGSGDKRLVAYVVGEMKKEGSGQVELDGGELRQQLRGRLPEYMVPSTYAQIKELPLNANGKLDRKRLLTLALKPASRQFQEARDSLETRLQQIWAEVLDRENISVNDNFFDIGGHSMKAVLLSARISRAFQKEAPVKLIFDKPTIEEQASFLRGDAGLNSPGSLVPIQRAGSRQPIFCVHPFFGLAHCYQELSRLLGPDQPFYGLQCYGLETDQTPLSTIPEMAKFYLQAIRTVQPHGPFQLAGWSMGALIAYEIARQLAAEGEAVSFLGLFEGHVPQPALSSPAPSHNEWEKLVDEREAENFRYMARQVPTSEEEASDRLLQMGRYLAEFTQVSAEFSREQLTRLSRIIAINQLAVESYRPGPYPGNVSLFRVPGQADAERSYGWTEFVRGELKIFEVPGTHDGFMSAPSVNIIASHLKCLLHADNLPSEKMFDRYS